MGPRVRKPFCHHIVMSFWVFFCLGSLVTLIRHPSELVNVPLHQQQNKCTTLVKNKTAGAATTLQLTYPLFTANACSSGAGTGLSQTQVRKARSLLPVAQGPFPFMELILF